MSKNILEMRNISKVFGDVVANKHINLSVSYGQIHAIVGENGAGKTTLMNILYGLYAPTTGDLIYKDEILQNMTPALAVKKGIGMVHQHFMLIPPLTVYENIILGAEPTIKKTGVLDKKRALEKIKEMSRKYSLDIDPLALVENLSVGEQQRVEILKVLYRSAELIILDEPTAVLTPQEVDKLFEILKLMKNDGKTIILITHKLKEVLAISGEITVIRRGEVITSLETKELNKTKAPENELANYMVGRPVLLRVKKTEAKPGNDVMRLKNLTVNDNRGIKKVDNVSFNVASGEIVGIAGVDGNGQTELIEAMTGLRPPIEGELSINGKNMTFTTSREFFDAGAAHIPEDRHKHGLILEMQNNDNFILGKQWLSPYQTAGFLNYRAINKMSDELIKNYDIRPDTYKVKARNLSGGNQQKLIVAREMTRQPKFLIASQPTRGVDIGAIEFIHKKIVAARDGGCGVLLVSAELSEILSLSDRILIMFDGKIVKEFVNKGITEKEIGVYMMGSGA